MKAHKQTRFALGLLLALSLLAGASITVAVLAQQETSPQYRDPQLERFYTEYNKQYFSSKLPQEMVVVWDDNLLSVYGDYAFADRQGKRIMVASEFQGLTDPTRIYILHEMTHFELWRQGIELDTDGPDGHGPKFQSEMRRLALSGAFDEIW